MSITLNATLKAAQDGSSHRPIIEILSVGLVADIPFDGELLTDETTNEQKSNIIMHSTGRLVSVYIYGTAYIEFVKTDTGKTEFIHTRLTQAALGCPAETITEATLCELADGSIGIVFNTVTFTHYNLRYAIVAINGSVSSYGLIAAYAKASYTGLKSPFCIGLADGSYLLAYILDDTSYLSKIYKRTSADFATWSVESLISIGGIGTNEKSNVSLCQIDNDDIFLMLDYHDDTNYSNCYYSISSDNGATWSAAVALTSYSDVTASGLHPVAYQPDTNEINIIYYESRTALWMTTETDGMPDLSKLSISDITVDSAGGKAYLIVSHMYSGDKVFYAVVEIDILTWEVTDFWNTGSTPGFNTAFAQKHIWWFSHTGYGHIVPIAITHNKYYRHVAVLDAQEDTITNYNFSDHADDLAQNLIWIAWGLYGVQTNFVIDITYVDANSRLWVVQSSSYSQISTVDILYIDLEEEPYLYEGSNYYHTYQVVRDSSVTQAQAASKEKCMHIDTTNNYIYLSLPGTAGYPGQFKIYDMTEGTSYLSCEYFPHSTRQYVVDIDTGLAIGTFVWISGGQFPRNGLKRFIILNDKIYGIFDYESGYGESAKRGLCEIVTETEGGYIVIKEVNYYRPTWATYNDYLFKDLKATEDDKIIVSGSYGVTIFDPATKEWDLFDNTNYPGLTSDGEDNFFSLGYDPTTGMVLTGRAGVASTNDFVGFSRDGPMAKTYYRAGTYSGGVWSFAAAAELIQGYNDFEAVPAVDPDDSALYVFWTNRLRSELSIKWDNDMGQFDLTPYLLRKTEVSLKWSMDNKPGSLSFGVKNGHLFDPYNVNSLISRFLSKERKITVRIGEEVGGTEYWQNQGSFLVKSLSMSGYERGVYPEANVRCEDVMSLWGDIECITTEYYETDAESVIEDILEEKAQILPADIDDFSFDNSATIYSQWLDSDVMTIVSAICDRFGYFAIIDTDGKATCRKIADDNAVAHTYTSNDALIRWSPQDEYADTVNRITVVGEERDFSEIAYSEEMIVTKSGTAGWWSGGERIKCYYSEDRTKKCLYPRLEWIVQPTGLGIWKDDLEAYIEEHDDQLGCDLVIDAPNHAMRLLYLLGFIAAKWAMPDGVAGHWTVPIGRLAEGALLIAIMDVLTAVTNWQATIHGRPVGMVRRSIQAVADDEDHQKRTNKIIPLKIEEPMCYTVAQCQEVADHERMLKQLQRRRVTLSKVMHLQDEAGDTIRALHPFSGQNLDIYITSLTRRYKMPTKIGDRDGYCIDDIEGWKI